MTPHDVTLPRPPAPGARDVLALAIPALGTLAAEPLLGLVDTALVGHLGATPLAALGAASAILNLAFSLLVFLEYGTTARLGRRYGAGDHTGLVDDAIQTFWLATALGVGMTLLLTLCARPLLALVAVPPGAEDAATAYLAIRGIGALPGLWLRAGNGVFRALQDTRTPLAIVVGMNALNAALDVLLIYGWSAIGIPALGIAGAAWASVIATTSGTAIFVTVLSRRLARLDRDAAAHATVRTRRRPNLRVLRELTGVSANLVVRTVSLMAALFMGTRMAAMLGTVPLAAHQVAWQLWMFLALVLDSVAIAAQALVSRLLGAGAADGAAALGNRLIRWSVWMGIAFAALFVLLRPVLPRVFTDDPAVLAAVDGIFLVLALMQIPNAVLFTLDGLLIGASDFAFLRNAMAIIGTIGAVAAWAAGRLGGSLGWIWLAIALFILLRLAAMGARWRGGRWAGPPAG
jgi:putative MATE family efflux protein